MNILRKLALGCSLALPVAAFSVFLVGLPARAECSGCSYAGQSYSDGACVATACGNQLCNCDHFLACGSC